MLRVSGGRARSRVDGTPTCLHSARDVDRSSGQAERRESPPGAEPTMRLARLILLAAVTASTACAGPASEEASSGTDAAWRSIEGGWLLDVEAGARVENPGVLVSPEGRIQRVGMAGAEPPPNVEPEVITLADDQTLLPGLIDLHAHYNMDLTGDGRVEETRYNPLIFLAIGVTTTFP